MSKEIDSISNSVENLSSTANEILKAAGQAFPEIANKGFSIYTNFMYAQGIVDLILAAISLIFLILSVCTLFHSLKRIEKACCAAEFYMLVALASVIVGFISTIALINNVYEGVIYTLCPEGAVLHEIIKTINPQ